MRKRTILLLSFALVFVSAVMASSVDSQQAIQVAKQFVPQSSSAQRAPSKKKEVHILYGTLEEKNDSTNVSGEDAGWGDGYNLIYIIDGQIYKIIAYELGAIITAEPVPTKEGYIFSGWSEIPETMPAHDVEVTGSFYLTGDVNNDGTVDISDYIGVANYILGNTPDEFNETAADVNNDGTIDISDYIGVANIILTGKP